MEKVSLYHDIEGEPFYCPFCGKMTVSRRKPFEKKENACKHLLYLGVLEGGIVYCAKKAMPLVEPFEESGDEDDLINLDIANAVHFSLCAPAPSFDGMFIGYIKYIDALEKK